jgi:hypothetical protein
MEDCSEDVIEELWVVVLAHVWNQVKWRRIRGRRHLDVFEHRLEYAKYELDVASVLQKLANTLSIQGIDAPLDAIEGLRRCNDVAMDVLRKWTKLLALKASIRAREERMRMKSMKEPEPEAEGGESGETGVKPTETGAGEGTGGGGES